MAFHEDIDRLIPWYVNGTLNESEMDLVNRHLRSCSRCSDSVEAEVRFARKLRAKPAGYHQVATAEFAWSAFTARLPRRRPLAPAAPIAALLSLMLVVASGSFLAGQQLQRPVFETMTAPPAYHGPVVQLVFEPDVPEQTIRRIVLELGGTVIAGPTSNGIYRVGLPADGDAQSRVNRLHHSPAVRWASLEGP